MSYTIGNWTISSLTTDSISTPKTPSIPDLDYADDFVVTESSKTDVQLANTTGAGIQPVEYLRYGRTPVSNIYSQFSVPTANQTPVKGGVRTLQEVRYLLKATNSVSGAEILLPMRGWICLEVPTADFISSTAISELLARTIAAAYPTGGVTGALVTDVARGDLDPTR